MISNGVDGRFRVSYSEITLLIHSFNKIRAFKKLLSTSIMNV